MWSFDMILGSVVMSGVVYAVLMGRKEDIEAHLIGQRKKKQVVTSRQEKKEQEEAELRAQARAKQKYMLFAVAVLATILLTLYITVSRWLKGEPPAETPVHRCQNGTHLCWTGPGVNATCIQAGLDYTCECPHEYVQNAAHVTHAQSVDGTATHTCITNQEAQQAATTDCMYQQVLGVAYKTSFAIVLVVVVWVAGQGSSTAKGSKEVDKGTMQERAEKAMNTAMEVAAVVDRLVTAVVAEDRAREEQEVAAKRREEEEHRLLELERKKIGEEAKKLAEEATKLAEEAKKRSEEEQEQARRIEEKEAKIAAKEAKMAEKEARGGSLADRLVERLHRGGHHAAGTGEMGGMVVEGGSGLQEEGDDGAAVGLVGRAKQASIITRQEIEEMVRAELTEERALKERKAREEEAWEDAKEKLFESEAYIRECKRSGDCNSCWGAPKVMACVPCGHRSLCEKCAKWCRACPVCKAKPWQIIRVSKLRIDTPTSQAEALLSACMFGPGWRGGGSHRESTRASTRGRPRPSS
jgi:DNA-binding protein H-NS